MDLSWSALELVHAHIAHRAVAPQPSPIAPKRCGNAPRRWDYQFVPDDLEVYPKSTPSKKTSESYTTPTQNRKKDATEADILQLENLT